MKRKEGYSCPVCRAANCRYNEHDTCLRYIPGREPGYNCPDFNCPTNENEIVGWLIQGALASAHAGNEHSISEILDPNCTPQMVHCSWKDFIPVCASLGDQL